MYLSSGEDAEMLSTPTSLTVPQVLGSIMGFLKENI